MDRLKELQAELSRLESLAPKFSEGGISATQYNRMGKRAREQYHKNMNRRFALEEELGELLKTPQQKAQEEATAALKRLRGRLAQLDAHIQMAKNLGWPTKRANSKARMQYEKDSAEREEVQRMIREATT